MSENSQKPAISTGISPSADAKPVFAIDINGTPMSIEAYVSAKGAEASYARTFGSVELGYSRGPGYHNR